MAYFNEETMEIENVSLESIPDGTTGRIMNWVLWGRPGRYPTGKEIFEAAQKKLQETKKSHD